MMNRVSVCLAVWVLLLVSAVAFGISPEEKCEADKNKIAGKYAFCRQRAEAKGIRKGVAADYSKCDDKLTKQWAKAEFGAVRKGTTCMDSVSEVDIRSFVAAHGDAVAQALDNGALPNCGDGTLNAVGEQCDGGDLGGWDCTTFGFSAGILACNGACGIDTSACTIGGGGLIPGVDPILPATGQLTPFGPGTDGDVQGGRELSFTDNGDGTITDNNTGLMWEKKDDSGGVHDKDYRPASGWSGVSFGTTYEMDGPIKTDFLDMLNDVSGGGANCFAGYCDWRIPNVRELASIVDYEKINPTVDTVFHQSATCSGCTDVNLAACSCTSCPYWSSSTWLGSVDSAWIVNFCEGSVMRDRKDNDNHVRAVRGGL